MASPISREDPPIRTRLRGGHASYRATPEAEARVLLLIDAFSRKRGAVPRALEGRVKLAKLDFLLRYPRHLRRVLTILGIPASEVAEVPTEDLPLDSRMMRYRYGPWDPAYYAILGSLVGRGLVDLVPLGSTNGVGFRTSPAGAALAQRLLEDESFEATGSRISVLRRRLDRSGTALKRLLYELPEVSDAAWHEELT